MNERKRRIMEEATKLFAQKGYLSTSIQDIVECSGISKGSFYNYFQSKEELMISMIQHYHETMMKKMAEIEQDSTLTPKESFMKQVKIQLEGLYSHKELIQMQMTEASLQRNEELHHFVFKTRAQSLNWLCKRMVDVYGEYIVPYALDCATLLSGMVKEYLVYVVIDKKDIALDQLIPFLFRRLDAVVASFSKNENPILNDVMMADFIHVREREKEGHLQQLAQLLADMREKLASLRFDKAELEKILSSIDAIETEFFNSKQKAREYIVEALLLYIKTQNIRELEKDIEALSTSVKILLN
ncbi:MAG: TetR/AcrR family transcriptional regulator [Ectobacillus sp.]